MKSCSFMSFFKNPQSTNPLYHIIFSPLWFVQFLYLIIVSAILFRSFFKTQLTVSGRDIIGFFNAQYLLFLAIFIFICNLFLFQNWQAKKLGNVNPFALLNLLFLICASVFWYEYIVQFLNSQNI